MTPSEHHKYFLSVLKYYFWGTPKMWAVAYCFRSCQGRICSSFARGLVGRKERKLLKQKTSCMLGIREHIWRSGKNLGLDCNHFIQTEYLMQHVFPLTFKVSFWRRWIQHKWGDHNLVISEQDWFRKRTAVEYYGWLLKKWHFSI